MENTFQQKNPNSTAEQAPLTICRNRCGGGSWEYWLELGGQDLRTKGGMGVILSDQTPINEVVGRVLAKFAAPPTPRDA